MTAQSTFSSFVPSMEAIKTDAQGIMWNLTKQVCQTIENNGGYLSIGDFLKQIGDEELNVVCQSIEEIQDIDESSTKEEIINPSTTKTMTNLFTLAVLLSQSEGGIEIEGHEALNGRVRYIMLMIVFEMLARRGLVKINYQFVTFGGEYDNETVVTRIGVN